MKKIKDKLQARAKFTKGKRVGYARGDDVTSKVEPTDYQPGGGPSNKGRRSRRHIIKHHSLHQHQLPHQLLHQHLHH
jgi:hypothetical protein